MNHPESAQIRLLQAVRYGRVNDLRRTLKSLFVRNCAVWSEEHVFCSAVDKRLISKLVCDSSEANVYSPLQIIAERISENKLRRRKCLSSKKAILNAYDKTGRTLLHLGVYYDHVSIVEALLQHGASTDICDNNGQSPLMSAVRRRNLKLATILMDYCAAVDKKSNDNTACLHVAVQNGDYEMVKALLSRRASVDVLNNEGRTPLNLAIRNKHADIVELLAEAGADIHHKDPSGESMLHLAIRNDNYDITKLLSKEDVDITLWTAQNITPKHKADNCRSLKICELLFKFGADANVVDNNGKSLLHLAVEQFSYEIAELLLRNNADVNKALCDNITPFFTAVKCGNKRMCELLLKFGARTDILDEVGKSIFYYAVERNCSEIAQLLLESNNASANEEFQFNNSPIYLCIIRGYERLFSLLLSFGAALDIQMQLEDKNILYYAVEKGFPLMVESILKYCDIVKENFSNLLRFAVNKNNRNSNVIIKCLLDNGFHFSEEDMRKGELVSLIIMNGCVGILEDFLKRGLGVNERIVLKNDFCTLLHLAVNHKQENVAKFLLAQGAKLNVVDSRKKTPLLLAVENTYCRYGNYAEPYRAAAGDNLRLTELFLKMGAEVDGEDAPLYAAISNGNIDIVQLLLHYGANSNRVFGSHRFKETALSAAFFQKKPGVFKMLLDNFSDINVCIFDTCFLYRTLRLIILRYRRNYDFEKSAFKTMHELLQHHVVKLKVANLFLNETFRSLPCNFVNQHYREQCEIEVGAMKNNYIGEMRVSFYQILTSTPANLMAYWGDESFQAVIKTNPWRVKFPLYQSLIHSKLTEAKRKKQLSELYDHLIRTAFPLFYSLPDLVIDKINSYFTAEDIRKIAYFRFPDYDLTGRI